MDLSRVDLNSGAAPSVGLACQLASGVVAGEVVKVITQKGVLRTVPSFQQFDPYQMRMVKGRLRLGNRSPLQKLKQKFLHKTIVKKT